VTQTGTLRNGMTVDASAFTEGMARATAEAGGWGEWVRTAADVRAVANGCWFDVAAAERFREFCRKFLRHTMGSERAKAGDPFELLDWQYRDVFAPLLGWKRADGRRRFEKAYISTAKKAGKSTILGALAIYLLLTEGPRAHLYSAAVEREQAAIIFGEAAAMIRASAGLSKLIRAKPSTKTLVAGDSFYRALSSDAGSKEGLNANAVFVDELHAWRDRALFDALAYAGSARPNALTVIITTAGDDMNSVWGEEYTRAKRWLAGDYVDDHYYAVIYEADPADDWTSPATWAKANPSLGHTVTVEKIEAECREAKEIPSAQARFKRYRCNLPVSLEATWLNMTAWDECAGEVDPETLKGRTCYAGLDLASVNDLCALTLLFPEDDGTATVLPIFWLPGDNIDALAKQHKVSYRVWTDTGALRTTEGNVIDYDQIVAQIIELGTTYKIKQLGIDRLFQGQAVETRLMNAGLDVVPIGQGWRSQSLPAKELERLILSRRLRHGGHPILRWNAGNVVAVRDSADNISISKNKSRSKIDGIAALLMSLLCKLNDTNGTAANYYETHDLIVLD
jgi:phage terminase large subunit-like protein